jgi:hypothetical protein
MSTRYTKAPVPSTPEELPSYLQAELDKLATVISNIADGHFDTSNVAITKPRAGDMRYADGTNWNPGAGEGLYIYLSNGAWSKL